MTYFFALFCAARRLPFAAGREAAAAAAAQAGLRDFLHDLLGRQVQDRLFRRRVAAVMQILVDVFRINRCRIPSSTNRCWR